MKRSYRDPRNIWEFYALNKDQLPWPQCPIKEEDTLPDFDPSSRSSLTFLKKELANCLANHPKCRVADQFTPTRLLSLVDALTFRITKLPKTGIVHYIALSYCWGKDQALKLVAANEEQLEQGLLISDLPVVFRDTIEVARKIGICYLWIDSLCILQDSTADWQAESAVMPQIYKSAYLTIAASSSSSTTESYLSPDPAKTTEFDKPLKFLIRNAQGERIRLAAIPQNRTSRHEWPYQGKHPEPLLKRGWTLQERLLATRTISSGLGELEYICATATSCECGAGTGTNSWDEKHCMNISAHAVESQEQALHFWYAQVPLYSERALTYGHDKLPAISGLARVLAPKVESMYLAGIWEEDLARGLSWLRESNPECSDLRIEGSYRAPTWSWAALNGSFGYPTMRGHHLSLLKARECSTTPKGGDSYGEICDGRITVYGALFRVALFYDYGLKWRVEPPRPEPDFAHMLKINLDGMIDICSIVSSSGSNENKVIRSTEAYNVKVLKSCVSKGLYVHILPLAYVPHARREGAAPTIDGRYNLLVLVESLKKPGSFERIGLSYKKGTNRQFCKGVVEDFVNEEDTVVPWSDEDYTEVTIV